MSFCKIKGISESINIAEGLHGINTGVLSLLVLLALVCIYMVFAFRYIVKFKKINDYKNAGIGILTGIIGYLIAGFFNDSIVSVAPVFWTLLGMGIVVNYKLRGLVENEVYR